MVRLTSPLQYRPLHGGRTAFGYDAMLLPDICEVILDAERAGKLQKNQRIIADTAQILLRGFARIGVIALVDEATGFQADRAKDELAKILEKYISEALRPWVRQFPNDFFKEIYRLQGWEYKPGNCKRPPYVGHLINKYVYEQLPPGVLAEMRKRNPITESGRRKRKHHQHLTDETGIPHLDRQLAAVTTLMKAAPTKQSFRELFDRAFAKQTRLPFELDLSAKTGAKG